MHTLEHLRHLFSFNEWANSAAVDAVSRSGSEKAARYLSHILTTEHEYYARLGGKDSTGFDFWPELRSAELGELFVLVRAKYRELLDSIDETGLDAIVDYKTSQGVPYRNTYREILTHVLLHSMNHRGQVLSALRADGSEPPQIDYIVFLRQNS